MRNIYKYTTDLKRLFEAKANLSLKLGDRVKVKSPHSDIYLDGEITQYEAAVDSDHSGMYLVYVDTWKRSEWFRKEDIDI